MGNPLRDQATGKADDTMIDVTTARFTRLLEQTPATILLDALFQLADSLRFELEGLRPCDDQFVDVARRLGETARVLSQAIDVFDPPASSFAPEAAPGRPESDFAPTSGGDLPLRIRPAPLIDPIPPAPVAAASHQAHFERARARAKTLRE